jgi:hypothetical protein
MVDGRQVACVFQELYALPTCLGAIGHSLVVQVVHEEAVEVAGDQGLLGTMLARV